ncbi:poly rna polymerase [Stylonychia lemnae]|uniref:polynucleotide adenylyltransferase n=1 Tax=Stylonychia lemnae TaxID=5949 RepID=A0A078B6W5_STYLE|nr:poly rna polymerase [Stylonychia lemnae]|eukprot:CDW89037.1 poly rna polymerase [Stylonychia lemnae]
MNQKKRLAKQNHKEYIKYLQDSQKEKIDPLDQDFLAFESISDQNARLAEEQKKETIVDLETRIASKFNREDEYPWLTDDTLKIRDAQIFLHNEMLDFMRYFERTDQDHELRRKVVGKISNIIKECYPESQVMIFGSCATGLDLPNSDVDMLVYYPDQREQTMINRLSGALMKQKICKSLEPIKHAKVPIIKLQEKETLCNVDISFNRTNGVYCVKLVKNLMLKYPELKPLMIVIKAFLKCRNLNETYSGGVSSFLLTMMVTSYLQICYKKGNTDKTDLGKHLIDFFELYGTKFNYEEIGISIRGEGYYFKKIKRGWYNYEENKKGRLCVENPQEPTVDIGFNAYNIKRVQRAFQHAYDSLIYNNSNTVSILKLLITSNISEFRLQQQQVVDLQ